MKLLAPKKKGFNNKYEIKGDTTVIYVKRRDGTVHEVLIDTDDLEKIKSYNLPVCVKWNPSSNGFYAAMNKYMGKIDGKFVTKTIYLHHVIKPIQEGQLVDHKNHNMLDNRKENLEVTTWDINLINRYGANKNNSTGVRNVCYDKSSKKYIVQLMFNSKNTCFGRFDTLEEAEKFAKQKRKELYGEEYE